MMTSKHNMVTMVLVLVMRRMMVTSPMAHYHSKKETRLTMITSSQTSSLPQMMMGEPKTHLSILIPAIQIQNQMMATCLRSLAFTHQLVTIGSSMFQTKVLQQQGTVNFNLQQQGAATVQEFFVPPVCIGDNYLHQQVFPLFKEVNKPVCDCMNKEKNTIRRAV
jgi:hypothetical protein